MIGIYARVSTQEQAREGYSIDEQLSRLRAYAQALGWAGVQEYVDAGFSGGNTNRPDLQRMVQDVEDGKLQKVVVYKLDRLSRSQKDTLNLIEDTFLAHGCEFVSISENFDTSSPFGRAMIGILAVFAKLEREQIKERMTLGREGRAKEGLYHGGANAPIGYDYAGGQLTVNEFEALQVREAFDLCCRGFNPGQIERIFSDKGYHHRRGVWYYGRILAVLRNTLYAGQITFQGNEYQGQHTPLVSNETFDKAQAALDARTIVKHSNRVNTALGGLIFCRRCGARYGIIGHRQYKYYACRSRSKAHVEMIVDPTCMNKTWRKDKLDAAVFDEISKLAIDPEYLQTIQGTGCQDDSQERAQVLQAELDRLDAQRARLLRLYGLGSYTIDELQREVDPLNDQRAKLEAELRQAEATGKAGADDAVEIARSFQDILARGVYPEIRMVIETLIRRIEIEGDDIFIYWRFV